MPNNEQHHNGGGRPRSKSRGKSQEPRNSHGYGRGRGHGYGRGRGGGAGGRTAARTTINTEITTGRGGRGRRGRGGGGQQHQQHEHAKPKSLEERQKELDAEKEKAAEHIAKQRAMNAEIEQQYQEKLDARLHKYGQLASAYKELRDGLLADWEADKATVDYDEMSRFEQKKYDRGWKRHIAIDLQDFLRKHNILGIPTRNDIAREYHAERKALKAQHDKAKQLALPAPPTHTHAHDHAAHDRAPRPLTGLDNLDVDDGPKAPQSQFSYDKALWGAQTHTRARDSLRYL